MKNNFKVIFEKIFIGISSSILIGLFFFLFRKTMLFFNLEIVRLISADISDPTDIFIASMLFFILGYLSLFVRIMIKSYFFNNNFKDSLIIFKNKCTKHHLFLFILIWLFIITVKLFCYSNINTDFNEFIKSVFEFLTVLLIFNIPQDTLSSNTSSMAPWNRGGLSGDNEHKSIFTRIKDYFQSDKNYCELTHTWARRVNVKDYTINNDVNPPFPNSEDYRNMSRGNRIYMRHLLLKEIDILHYMSKTHYTHRIKEIEQALANFRK